MRGVAAGATVVAALSLAPVAAGHGSVRPTVAAPGATEEFTFLVLNGEETGIVGFRLELPAGAAVVDVAARQPTWVATSSEAAIEWRGGPIPGRAFESFQARVRMPEREGTVTFRGTELFAEGPGAPYRLDVVVAGGTAPAGGEATDEGARTLAAAALVVGIAGVLLAAAALALGLARRRRPA